MQNLEFVNIGFNKWKKVFNWKNDSKKPLNWKSDKIEEIKRNFILKKLKN